MNQPWDLAVVVPARIARKIGSSNDRGCWLWTAATSNGYGVIQHNGRIERAHRVIYELLVGTIPPGMFLLHRCDTPACVNPDHLFPGTNQDNVDDKMRKGRHVKGGTHRPGNYERGDTHHAARLNESTVRQIRADRDNGKSFALLSKEYGIAIGHIFRIVRGKAWKHVA